MAFWINVHFKVAVICSLHAHTHVHTLTRTHTCTHTHTHTHLYKYTYTHTHTHTHTCTHTYTRTHINTYTYTRVHTHTHTDVAISANKTGTRWLNKCMLNLKHQSYSNNHRKRIYVLQTGLIFCPHIQQEVMILNISLSN